MAPRVYATAADYYDFIGQDQPMTTGDTPVPVPNKTLDADLRRASEKVDRDTRTSIFETDADGMPTDADIVEAFKRATCAYVAWFNETGDITGAGSQETVRIGSVSLGGAGSSGSADNRRSAADARTAPEAIDILITSDLISAVTAHS